MKSIFHETCFYKTDKSHLENRGRADTAPLSPPSSLPQEVPISQDELPRTCPVSPVKTQHQPSQPPLRRKESLLLVLALQHARDHQLRAAARIATGGIAGARMRAMEYPSLRSCQGRRTE